jgi:hypothetical protein
VPGLFLDLQFWGGENGPISSGNVDNCWIFSGFLWNYGFLWIYPLVNKHNYGKSPFLMEKLTINGAFSIAMLNYQRVVVGFSGLVEVIMAGWKIHQELLIAAQSTGLMMYVKP